MADILVRHLGRRRQRAARRRHRRRAAAPRPRASGSSGTPASATPLTAAGLRGRAAAHARPFSPLDDQLAAHDVRTFGDRGLGRDVLAALAAPSGRPGRRRLHAVRRDGGARARPGTPYVVLEHLYDAYFRRSWLRGPMGLGMRLMRLRPGRLAGRGPRDAGRQPARRSTRPVPQPRGDVTYVGPVVDVLPARVRPTRRCWSASARSRSPRCRSACRRCSTRPPTWTPASWSPPARSSTRRRCGRRPTTSCTASCRTRELMPSMSLVVGHGGHGDDHAGAGPRPAAGRDADAPACSTSRWSGSRVEQAGAGPAGVEEGLGRRAARRSSPSCWPTVRTGQAAARLGAAGPGDARRRQRAPTGSRRVLRDGAAAPGRRAARP